MASPPNESTPLEQQTPPAVQASPTDLPAFDDPNLTWWQPGWEEISSHLWSRWYYFLPLVLVLLLVLGLYFLPMLFGIVLGPGLKLLLLAGGLSLVPVGQAIRSVTRARTEPFCIHCGYNLTGLPDHHRCPECGRPYAWRVIDEYRRDPQWFIQRYKAAQRLPRHATPFAAGPHRPPGPSRDGTS